MKDINAKTLDSLIISLNTALNTCTNERTKMSDEVKFFKNSIAAIRVPGKKLKKNDKKFINVMSLGIAKNTHSMNIAKRHIDNIVKTILFVKRFQANMKNPDFEAKVYSHNDYGALINAVYYALYLHNKHIDIVKHNIATAEAYIESKELAIKHLRCETPTNDDAIFMYSNQAHNKFVELSDSKRHLNYHNNEVKNLNKVITLLQNADKHDRMIKVNEEVAKQMVKPNQKQR